MTEFFDQDLRGARFERVQLNGATLRRVDLSGIDVRIAVMEGGRLHGVEIRDTEINGEFSNLRMNGVDVAPLIEQELDRRDPERVKIRPVDADGFREGWRIVCRRWDETVESARALPADALHASVGGEWSFIETLRHLGFATAAWIGRMILGEPSPWHPLDLPWNEAPGWDGIPWDRDVRPSLDEVLAVRAERRAMVDEVMASLSHERLASTVSMTEPGWPRIEQVAVSECLQVVLIEEWEHRNYFERDLAVLRAGDTT